MSRAEAEALRRQELRRQELRRQELRGQELRKLELRKLELRKLELAKLGPRLDECVHCGLCLPTCPTYAELGTEMDSPRGRLWLVRALAEGRIGATETVHRHLDGCLDCRACESACPSGVRYGQIIERARGVLEPGRDRSPRTRALRRLGFAGLLGNEGRLGAATRLLRAFDGSGLRALIRRLPFLPARARGLLKLSPRPRHPSFTDGAPSRIPARGEPRGQVALFPGCVMNQVMAPVHEATARVLAANGYTVLVPKPAICCGALHLHAGERETATALAKRVITTYERLRADAIVLDSAGCGAAMREYPELLADDAPWRARAVRLASRTRDVAEFLVEVGFRPPTAPVRVKAAWDEPCHLIHAQGISAEPRRLLVAIPGLTLLPLDEAEWCCGSAGVYNLAQPEMSARLLRRKMDRVAACGAEILVTANPGCLLQLQAGVRERGLDVEVVHLVEVLARSYGETRSHGETRRGRGRRRR